jgi:hypothetical protein
MKTIVLIISATLGVFTASAQTLINDPNAQKRAVGSFHAIEVSNAIDLYLSQANEETVAVSAKDPKYISKIITEVENGVLKIHIQNTGHIVWGFGGQKLKAYVSFKTIDRLAASGSSDVYVDGAISGIALDIHLSGSSDFKGNVKVSQLNLDQSGSSDATIGGTASNISINLSGASDVKAYELITDKCTAHASGSSDVRITVNKELNVSASGSSDIYYKGTGVIKDVHSSGSSSVSKKD